MPKRTGICRVCGKKYAVCNTVVKSVFNWREVACSPECGQEYFRQVLEARAAEDAAAATESRFADEESFDPNAEIETFFNENSN